jgi:Zn-dependent protease with chaperone function
MTPAERRTFPGLSARAYEHPADRAALVALRAVPGFDVFVRSVAGAVGDRALRLVFMASAVRLGERQLPDVYARYLEACRILDIETPPELYVAQTPLVNAGALGVDRPFIVLNSGTIELFDLDELQFILGHELGHVRSGHALYKTMLQLLLRLSTFAVGVPLGGAAFLAIAAALLEWDRCSELSADRAGLLAIQSPEVALRTNMKMAGGARKGLSLDEFIRQGEEYEASGTMVDSAFKLLILLGRTHPFPVLRVAEIKRWAEGGEYETVLSGAYARRGEDGAASVQDAAREASRGYQDSFYAGAERVGGVMQDIARETRAVQKAVLAALKELGRASGDEEGK